MPGTPARFVLDGGAVESEADTGAWARAVATLSLVTGSVYLFVLARLGGGPAFVAHNQPTLFASRVGPLLTLAIVGLTTAFGVALVRRRPSTLAGLALWADRLAPLIPLALAPGLLSRRLWADSELELLVALALVVGALELLLRRAIPAWRRFPLPGPELPAPPVTWASRALLATAILYYAVTVARLTVLNHHRMATESADMAEFDNLFFNALNGHPFRAPAIGGDLANGSALKVHAEFLLYLLLPFYALRPGPEALLVIQTVVVASTALPVYLLAARRLGEPTALLFGIAFLLMPAVQQPNFYDFHFLPLGMLCVSWTLYLADRATAPGALLRDRVLFGLAFVLALLSREDVSFGLAVLGLVLVASGRSPRLGLVVAVVALAYFGGVKFALMPRFGTMWFSSIYEDLKAPGREGFDAVVATLLTNPAFVLRKLLSGSRLLYLLHLVTPLAFLWIRRPWLALAAIPGLPFTLLATNREPLQQISFQYVYHWIPYVFAASVLGLELTGPRGSARRLAATVALAAASYVASFHFGALLGAPSIQGGFAKKQLAITPSEESRLARLRRVIAKIPPSASVAATSAEGPHVSTRLDLFSLHFANGRRPDFILFDRNALHRSTARALEALELTRYRVTASEGEFVLLGPTGSDAELRPVLASIKKAAGR